MYGKWIPTKIPALVDGPATIVVYEWQEECPIYFFIGMQ